LRFGFGGATAGLETSVAFLAKLGCRRVLKTALRTEILNRTSARYAELRRRPILGITARAVHPADSLLRAQLVKQVLGVLEIGGVEAFGEPVVDIREHCARLVAAVGNTQEARKTRGRPYFP
jgi:hypothetical protein